ncbi:MAG: two-component system response regulator [Novosphingobium sp.]|nr:two-component system response regulator [Novosphingobium sp.]MBX9644309.1 response regulator [Novosphingobium sp.]
MLILVAEDNPDNRNLLTRRLERQGWNVVTAEDGREAVDVCRSAKPDLVLMDVAMPNMNGLEATRALRADPATAATKIIAVTAHAMDANRIECIEAGCDDFATKPINFPELVAMIRDHMGPLAQGEAA